MWNHFASNAPRKKNASRHALALASGPLSKIIRWFSGDRSGPAMNTAPPLMPASSKDTPLEPILHARAVRLCNREPRAVARYMGTHQALCREAFSKPIKGR